MLTWKIDFFCLKKNSQPTLSEALCPCLGAVRCFVQRRERIYAFPTRSLGKNRPAGQECPVYCIFDTSERKLCNWLMDRLVFEGILRYFYDVLAVEAPSPSPLPHGGER